MLVVEGIFRLVGVIGGEIRLIVGMMGLIRLN